MLKQEIMMNMDKNFLLFLFMLTEENPPTIVLDLG
jgi:hypothetical protein